MPRNKRKTKRKTASRPDTRSRDQILELVETLGVARQFHTLPSDRKQDMYERCWTPLVSLDKSAEGDPVAEDAAEQLRRGLRDVRVPIGENETATVPLHAAWTAAPFLEGAIEHYLKDRSDHEAARCCLERVAAFGEFSLPNITPLLNNMITSRMMNVQRFDTALYGVNIPSVKQRHRVRFQLKVFREEARRKRIRFQKKERPVYQCGGYLRIERVDWLALRPADVGIKGPDEAYPVYVQGHAIKRLYERLGAPSAVNGPRTLLYYSLLQPNVVVKNSRGAMLIECRSGWGRLGYFVVRFLKDKFLVNTFLFLTMRGTPEARKLHERLNVEHHAIKMMRIDNLPAFCATDIRHDKELAAALHDCDCGHLLTNAEKSPFKDSVLIRQAAHLRRILGWSQDGGPDIHEPEAATEIVTQHKVSPAQAA